MGQEREANQNLQHCGAAGGADSNDDRIAVLMSASIIITQLYRAQTELEVDIDRRICLPCHALYQEINLVSG